MALLGLLSRRKDPRRTLKRVVAKHELPSFPAVAMRALKQMRSDASTAALVAETIAVDPGLSVRVLSTVNSAAFALRRKVTNLQQAVALLGMSQLESLVISGAVGDVLPGGPAKGFEHARFWRTAARRAAAARAFAQLLDLPSSIESFTAALLSDMAIPLLAHHGPKGYGDLLQHWHAEGGDLAELERSQFGWDHAEIAHWMCGEWALPPDLASALAEHHQSVSAQQVTCAPAVALVSCLRETDEHLGDDELVERAHAQYGVAPDITVALIERALEQAESLASALTR